MRAMEPLLYEHKVAVVIAGHVHGKSARAARSRSALLLLLLLRLVLLLLLFVIIVVLQGGKNNAQSLRKYKRFFAREYCYLIGLVFNPVSVL